MPASNLASAEPATPTRSPRPAVQESAERRLRSNPYLALKNVSCDCRGGVLVLRGCLPSYFLKQVAQEAVARLEGVRAVDNQIQVVTRTAQAWRGSR
jgi:osmotically-inducible protein OsmY